MLIKNIKLENIRSYRSLNLDFPEGIVLLSGDIGVGKTSVLLGIEFALFGIKRGDITGAALLRHGTNNASAELTIVVDSKEVIIKRTLKKTNYGVKQDAGFIVIDGVKTVGTAEEIKAQVLDLLGYPSELLKKGKDLIYRFTVYTPQEHMKAILFESNEERLDTLRKVFGIDKYKKIRENASLYISEIKLRKRELLGRVQDLDEKKKSLSEKRTEIVDISDEYESIKNDVLKSKEKLSMSKDGMLKLEKSAKDFEKKKGQVKLIEAQLMEKFLQRKRNVEKIELIKNQVVEYEKDEELTRDFVDCKALMVDSKSKIVSIEKEIQDLLSNKAQHDLMIRNATQVIQKIEKLDNCPTCMQEVNNDHKESIAKDNNSIIAKHSGVNEELSVMLVKKKDELSILKKKLDDLLEKEKGQALLVQKMKILEDKKKELDSLNSYQNEVKKEIGKLNLQKMDLMKEIDLSSSIEDDYIKSKQKYDIVLKECTELEKHEVALKVKLEQNNRILDIYSKEILSKEIDQKNIVKLTKIQNWLEQLFLNMMNIMEKNVMSQLYQEFNGLFVDWFRVLIEDETINVRLNDQFVPVVEQNGYDIALAHLSGGEKTSVALAYRLSLNKVINDFITHVKTRDIIILDEPTDGFSDEQLDRVREVLEQIRAKQIIIVSHEQKIESFVDKVVRIKKENHNSSVS